MKAHRIHIAVLAIATAIALAPLANAAPNARHAHRAQHSLVGKLKLSKEQKTHVRSIRRANCEQVKAVGADAGRAKKQSIRSAGQAKIRGVLTEKQQTRFDRFLKTQKNHKQHVNKGKHNKHPNKKQHAHRHAKGKKSHGAKA